MNLRGESEGGPGLSNDLEQGVAHARGGVKSAMKSGRLKVIARGASSGNSNVAVEPTSKANQLPEEPSSNKEQRV